jgi:hypothetical protein
MFYLIQYAKYCDNFGFWQKIANFCTISFIKVFLKSFFEYKKKMFSQYTHQLLSIILCSTLVNFYLLVIELLLNKTAIYGVEKDELLVWNLTKK